MTVCDSFRCPLDDNSMAHPTVVPHVSNLKISDDLLPFFKLPPEIREYVYGFIILAHPIKTTLRAKSVARVIQDLPSPIKSFVKAHTEVCRELLGLVFRLYTWEAHTQIDHIWPKTRHISSPAVLG
jgi:hypothetical protein